MLTDHKVASRDAAQIKASAVVVRKELRGQSLVGVNAANAVLQLTKRPNKSGECLTIEVKSAGKIGAPAVVSYVPLKLEVDRVVWNKALLSVDPDANYVIAHELGHVVLHDYHAQPYSGVKRDWIDFKEQSAEWQANRFADCFLVSDEEIIEYVSPDVIATKCRVPIDVAERRFHEIAKLAEFSCRECFGTNVYRIRTDHFCWSCRRSYL